MLDSLEVKERPCITPAACWPWACFRETREFDVVDWRHDHISPQKRFRWLDPCETTFEHQGAFCVIRDTTDPSVRITRTDVYKKHAHMKV